MKLLPRERFFVWLLRRWWIAAGLVSCLLLLLSKIAVVVNKQEWPGYYNPFLLVGTFLIYFWLTVAVIAILGAWLVKDEEVRRERLPR